MDSQVRIRSKNALASGAAALLTLLGMALWIGGLEWFSSIVLSGIGLLFLVISLVALAMGACLSACRIRWSILAGMLTGLAGGTVIVLSAMSSI